VTTTSPEQTIRAYLDEHGGETDASLDHLLTTFGIDESDQPGRDRIKAALSRADVEIDKPLPFLSADTQIHLFVADSDEVSLPPSGAGADVGNGHRNEEASDEPKETAPQQPAAWYPDPDAPGQLRWWDGAQWTEHAHAPLDSAPPHPREPVQLVGQEPSPSEEVPVGGEPPQRPAGPAEDAGGRAKRPWYKRWWVIPAAIVGLIAVAAALGSSGKENKAQNAVPLPIQLTATAPGTVKSNSVVLNGRVSPPDATVSINGRAVPVSAAGQFRERLRLNVGSNPIDVAAKAPGRTGDTAPLVVERRLTAAEIAAARERAAQRRQAALDRAAQRRQAALDRAAHRRELARQRQLQAKQNFIAAAQTIPYNQLNKSADSYLDTKVKYTGQVFQIQEDPYGGGGNMLLSVTDQGYGIWDDHVWVDYHSHIAAAENDVITIYGVVKGSKTYDTQIGGQTYVPQIDARYIE
jgi:hypothetical protein